MAATVASIPEALQLAIQVANSPQGKVVMADIGSFFSNLFSSNSLAPNATGTVQAGQVTLTGTQLVNAMKYLESIGVVKVTSKSQVMQISGVFGALGMPVSQELIAQAIADAPNA